MERGLAVAPGPTMQKLIGSCAFVLVLVGRASAAPVVAPVVGGTPVAPHAWPGVVSVELRGGWCSGTLIAPDVVLTAGHCVDAEPVAVTVDTIDFGKPGGERIAVIRSEAYPDWARSYDVGVLLLAHAAKAAPYPIAAACTLQTALVRGATAELVGFGLTTPAGTGRNTRLREAAIAITDPTCETEAGCEASVAPVGEFAAGGRGIDACFGDSGGPVFAATSGGPALMGVVSRGLSVGGAPCGGGGIYVRADRVVAWVMRLTGRVPARSRCAADGPADGTGEAAAAPDLGAGVDADAGGCNASGAAAGSGALLLIAACASVLARRRVLTPRRALTRRA